MVLSPTQNLMMDCLHIFISLSQVRKGEAHLVGVSSDGMSLRPQNLCTLLSFWCMSLPG